MNETIALLKEAKLALETASACLRTLLASEKPQKLASFNLRALTLQYLQQAFLYSENGCRAVEDILVRLETPSVK